MGDIQIILNITVNNRLKFVLMVNLDVLIDTTITMSFRRRRGTLVIIYPGSYLFRQCHLFAVLIFRI